MTTPIERFEDLNVYRDAFALQQRIYSITKDWPREEQYALTDQIRRSSRSVGANLAEAWTKRRYQAHFTSKLTDADGELAETRHWLTTANACAYLSPELLTGLSESCDAIGRMLGSMIQNAGRWTA